MFSGLSIETSIFGRMWAYITKSLWINYCSRTPTFFRSIAPVLPPPIATIGVDGCRTLHIDRRITGRYPLRTVHPVVAANHEQPHRELTERVGVVSGDLPDDTLAAGFAPERLVADARNVGVGGFISAEAWLAILAQAVSAAFVLVVVGYRQGESHRQ